MKRTLTVTTPHGTFTRTTARNYTHVVVYASLNKEFLQEELARIARTWGANAPDHVMSYVKDASMWLADAEAAEKDPSIVRDVTWHGSAQAARRSAANYRYTVRGIFPIPPQEAR